MLQNASDPILSKSLDQGTLVRIYRKLLLCRRAEQKIQQEYHRDEMKTPVHLGVGQEGIAVGVCCALPPDAKVFGTYRNHPLYLAMSEDSDGFFTELYGKVTGAGKGKAGSMHLAAPEHGLVATSAVVGTTIPLAVGAAFANSYRGLQGVVASFFGDGAVEEGVFWESINFACLHKLPILFVCEDNGLAIHTPASERAGYRSIPELLRAFHCHFASGDGSDAMNVLRQTSRILTQMREDPKPGFLLLSYFRFLEHVGIREDFDAGYRRRPTPEEIERLDPVTRFEKFLLQNGFSQADLAERQAEVDRQISRSVAAAQRAPYPAPSELYTDLFR